jgi:hypothetical protein
MTPDVASKIAALEARLSQQETLLRSLRYENECVKKELGYLRTDHEGLKKDHKALIKDHCLLSDDFLESRNKVMGCLEDHRDEIKELAIVAGNTANVVFPKLDDAFQEIYRAIGLAPKTQS